MAENRVVSEEMDERLDKIVSSMLQVVWFIMMVLGFIWVVKMIYFE